MTDISHLIGGFDASKWAEYNPDAPTTSKSRPWGTSRLDFNEVDAQLACDVEGRLIEWFPGEKITRSGNGFRVGDSNGLSVDACGMWNSFSGKYVNSNGKPGGKGLTSLYASIKGIELKDAARELRNGSNVAPFTKQSKPRPKKKTDYLPPSTPMDLAHPSLDAIKRGAESWHEYNDANGDVIGFVKRVKKSDGGKAALPVTWCHKDGDQGDAWHVKKVGDFHSDFDCAYTVEKVASIVESTTRTVSFENKKPRGPVAMKVTFTYDISEGLSWMERFDSIKRIDEKEAAANESAAISSMQRVTDEPIIKHLSERLRDGPKSTKTLTQDNLNVPNSGSRNERQKVLERYTDEIWGKSKGQTNGWNYYLIDNDAESPPEKKRNPWE